MTRMKVLGLCLVAAFALSAFAAAGAQAGTLGTCVKAKKEGKTYLGKYTNKTCTAEAPGGKGGKYEFEEAKNVKYTSAGGKTSLKGSAGEITCESNTDEGEWQNGKDNTDTFKFKGCVLSVTGGKCKSATGAEGEIITNLLDSKLIDHGETGLSGKEPAEGEAWVEFSASGLFPSAFGEGPFLATFECSGIPFAVTGAAAGKIGPVNVATKAGKPGKKPKYTFTMEFTETGGEQDLNTTFFNPLTSKVETGPSAQLGSGGAFFTAKGYEIKT